MTRQLTSIGSAGRGVFGGRGVLTDSTVTGNGGSTPPGADLLSKRPPKLVRTTCGDSWSPGASANALGRLHQRLKPAVRAPYIDGRWHRAVASALSRAA